MIRSILLPCKNKNRIIFWKSRICCSGPIFEPWDQYLFRSIDRIFFHFESIPASLYLVVDIFDPEGLSRADFLFNVIIEVYCLVKTVVYVVSMCKIKPCVERSFLTVFYIFIIRSYNISRGFFKKSQCISFFTVNIEITDT